MNDNIVPVYLRDTLFQAKKKHFKSMEYFLRRKLKKLYPEMDLKPFKITIRPEIIIYKKPNPPVKE